MKPFCMFQYDIVFYESLQNIATLKNACFVLNTTEVSPSKAFACNILCTLKCFLF